LQNKDISRKMFSKFWKKLAKIKKVILFQPYLGGGGCTTTGCGGLRR
jgi:hypothetical protein